MNTRFRHPVNAKVAQAVSYRETVMTKINPFLIGIRNRMRRRFLSVRKV